MAAVAGLSEGWCVEEAKVGDGDDRFVLSKRCRKVPQLLEGQVLIAVSFAALNRRDHWIRLGMYPGIQFSSTLGADCCGTVLDVADRGRHGKWIGRQVVVDSCQMWGADEKRPTDMFHILGMAPADGTLQQFLVVDGDRVYAKPDHLTPSQAAALPLAALTAYRATVTKGGVGARSKVLVTGIGGGVALFCLQIAVAMGAEVWVTSSSDAKIRDACKLGACGGFNYTEKGAGMKRKMRKAVPDGFDAVIDGAGGDAMNIYVAVLRRGGVIAQYGATAGRPTKLNVTRMFLNQIELRGTSMGSPREFEAMLALVCRHRITPVVSAVFPFEETPAAFNVLRDSTQFGKVVVAVHGGGGRAKL